MKRRPKEEPKEYFAECVGTDGIYRRVLLTKTEYEALLKSGATPVEKSATSWTDEDPS